MLDLYRHLYGGCPASGEGACTPLMCRTVLRGSSLQRPLRVLADRVSDHNVLLEKCNRAEDKVQREQQRRRAGVEGGQALSGAVLGAGHPNPITTPISVSLVSLSHPCPPSVGIGGVVGHPAHTCLCASAACISS